jgi:predicted kinase
VSSHDLEAEADRHEAHLERLCVDGGPLTTASPHASTNNPDWFDRSGGSPVPTRSRRDFHQRLLREFRDAKPAVRRDREAIVLAGPPGAGKSTAQEQLIAATGRSADHFRVINSDDFKDRLLQQALQDGSYRGHLMPPEVQRAEAAGEQFHPRELASLVHEESGMLASEATNRAIRRGENVVIDGTLSHQESARKLFRQLENAGYKVQVASVEAPLPVTQARIAHRWRTGYRGAATGTAKEPLDRELGGRTVPAGFTKSLYPKDPNQSRCREVAEWAKKRFRSIKQLKRYRVDVPKGTPMPERHPSAATPAAKHGRGTDPSRTPAAVRSVPRAVPGPSVGRVGPVPSPRMMPGRGRVERPQLPPNPRPRPDRGHGR